MKGTLKRENRRVRAPMMETSREEMEEEDATISQ